MNLYDVNIKTRYTG